MNLPRTELTLDAASALAAGDLGEAMQKFPLRFCKPIFFGPPPSRERELKVNNGTASLLRHDGQLLAITCAHVLDAYRKKRLANPAMLLAIGNCYFDPLLQIVMEHPGIDVCAINLTPQQAVEVLEGSTGIGQDFFEFVSTPEPPVKVGDFVTFGGFPGDLRRLDSFDALNFGTYSSGGTRVNDRSTDGIFSKFEREFWVRSGPYQ